MSVSDLAVSFNYLREIFYSFSGYSRLFWFIPAALLLSFFDRTKKRHGRVIFTVFFFLLVVYNPFTYEMYARHIDWNTYYRFFWLLPCYAAMAYILIWIVNWIPRDKVRLIIVVAVCIPVLLWKAGPATFSLPYTKYQIPLETIWVADRMDAIMDEYGLQEAMLLCDEDVAFTIRSYNARVILPYDPEKYTTGWLVLEYAPTAIILPKLMVQLRYNDMIMSDEDADRLMTENGVRFVSVFDDADSSIACLQRLGFTSAGSYAGRQLFYRI